MTDIIKFIHLLFVLGLLGLTVYCLIAVGSKKTTVLTASRWILYCSLFALLTGTLLVYPKHYTFHTHWIMAAYALVIIYSTWITVLKKRLEKQMNPRAYRWVYRVNYAALIVILIVIIHDAVTKSTVVF